MINETLLKSTFRLQKQHEALHERGLQLLPRRQPHGAMSSYFAHEHAAQVAADALAAASS